MPILTRSTQAHVFTGLLDLDDVTLYVDHHGRSGRITIVCYSNAWTAHLPDMDPNETPIDRLLGSSASDLIRMLQWGTPEILNRDRAKETAYLRHIVTEIQQELRATISLLNAQHQHPPA